MNLKQNTKYYLEIELDYVDEAVNDTSVYSFTLSSSRGKLFLRQDEVLADVKSLGTILNDLKELIWKIRD